MNQPSAAHNGPVNLAFEQAQQDVLTLTEAPGTADMLRLYALRKQALEGKAQGDQPGMFDVRARFKWDAWNALGDMPAEEAMQEYIDLVESLRG